MAHDSSDLLDLIGDIGQAGFDPFADADLDNEEDLGHDPDLVPKSPTPKERAEQEARAAALAQKPAAERIEKLFHDMPNRRLVIVALLAYLQEPRTPQEIQAKVDELEEHNRSIYNSASYCTMLQDAGAVTKVNAEGVPFSEGGKKEPETVVIDGVEYYRPTEPPQLFWKTTPDGDAVVAANDPYGRLVQLLDERERLLPIYERILQFCDVVGGKTSKEIAEVVDHDPIVMEKPRLYAPYFTNLLESCEAICWNGSGWQTTEVGRRGLDHIEELAHAAASAAAEDPAATVAQTQEQE